MYTANLRPLRAIRGEDSRRLRVSVLFTGVRGTLEALERASRLAAGLNAEIELLAPEEVPFPVPLEQHPVRQEHTAKRLRAIAGRISVPLGIHIIYCRDQVEAVRQCLRPESPLVVVWKRRWFFDGTSRLVRELRREGRQVITSDDRRRRADGGPVLHRSLWAVLRSLLGIDEDLRQALRR